MLRYLPWLLVFFSCRSPSPSDAVALDSAEYLDVNGFKLFVRQLGNGDPLLVIHGGPGLDHTYLMPQLGRLGKDARLIFYDQRGCGMSGHEVDSTMMQLNVFVADIEAIRQHLGIERIGILAHSWGGFLAMAYAKEHPEHISRMILMNSIPPDYTLWQKANDALFNAFTPEQRQAITGVQQSDAYQLGESAGYENLFRTMFRPQFANPGYADSLTLTLQPDFETTSQLFNYMMPDMINYDFSGSLRNLKCPVMVVYGDQEVTGAMAIPAFQSINPGWEIHTLRNCGHFPYIEAFSQLEKIVVPFLAR